MSDVRKIYDDDLISVSIYKEESRWWVDVADDRKAEYLSLRDYKTLKEATEWADKVAEIAKDIPLSNPVKVIYPNGVVFDPDYKPARKIQPVISVAAEALGRKGGSVKSPAKSEAAKARNAKRKAEGKPEGGRR